MTKEKFYWHKQQEQILKNWGEISNSYRYLHERSYQYYYYQNMWFAIPVIILSTITGTANFAQGSFPESAKTIAPIIIGSLNLIAGLITTVAQFLRVSELLESHRVSSVSFGKFARNITVELSLPIEERDCNGSDFLNTCRIELDKLIEQSPSVPLTIIKRFERKFKGKEFVRPDILDISTVQVYSNNEEEEEKIKEEIFRKEKEKRIQIIQEEKDKISEIIKSQELVKMKEKKRIKKELKNKKLSVQNIHGQMDKLIGMLQPNDTSISDITNESENIDLIISTDDNSDNLSNSSSDKLENEKVEIIVNEIVDKVSDEEKK